MLTPGQVAERPGARCRPARPGVGAKLATVAGLTMLLATGRFVYRLWHPTVDEEDHDWD